MTTTHIDLNPFWMHVNGDFTTRSPTGIEAGIQVVLVAALLAQFFAFGAMGHLERLSIRAAALAVFLAHAGILAWHVHADHAWTCLDAWSHGAASTCTTRAGTGTALMLAGPMLTLVSIALHNPRERPAPPPPLPPWH